MPSHYETTGGGLGVTLQARGDVGLGQTPYGGDSSLLLYFTAILYYCYYLIAIEYFTIAILSYCYTLLCLYEYVTMSVLDPGHTKEWPFSLGGGGFTASTCRRAVCGRVDGTR